MEKLFRFLYGDNKWGHIIMLLLTSVCVTSFLAIIVSSVAIHNFFLSFQYIFFYFGAVPIVSAILLLLKICPIDLAYGFGAGLYYGTIGIAAFINFLGWTMPNTALIVISFIITSLVCYIVYLNKYKREP